MSAFPDVVDKQPQLGGPDALMLPADWTLTTSLRRAQTADAMVNPVTDAEFMVRLDDGGVHRVTFAVDGGELVADCDCQGWTHRDWCAHVAHLWWRWSRGRLVVHDLDADRPREMPPAWLTVDREGEC